VEEEEAKATAEAEAAAAALKKRQEALHKKARAGEKAKQKKQVSKEEKEALKAKQLMKLVGAVVVKCLSKHKSQMDHDHFKKYAKELTQILADKEKKSSMYQSGKLDTLPEDKVQKIKKFCKEYIAKLLRKLEKKKSHGGHHRGDNRPSSSSTPQTPSSSKLPPTDTPEDEDVELDLNDTLDLMDDDDDDGDHGSPVDPFPPTDTSGQDMMDVHVVDPDAEAQRMREPRILRPPQESAGAVLDKAVQPMDIMHTGK